MAYQHVKGMEGVPILPECPTELEFADWKDFISSVLDENDILEYIDGTTQKPIQAQGMDDVAYKATDEYKLWKKNNLKAMNMLKAAISPLHRQHIREIKEASEAWTTICSSHTVATFQTLVMQITDFTNLEYVDAEGSILHFIVQLETAVAKLRETKLCTFDDRLIMAFLLKNLLPRFALFKAMWEAKDWSTSTVTFKELKMRVLAEERSFNADEDSTLTSANIVYTSRKGNRKALEAFQAQVGHP